MAKFARECLAKMGALTTKLEEALGPDTGDLTMRFGLNSGPVSCSCGCIRFIDCTELTVYSM